jgi:hypothetical protein
VFPLKYRNPREFQYLFIGIVVIALVFSIIFAIIGGGQRSLISGQFQLGDTSSTGSLGGGSGDKLSLGEDVCGCPIEGPYLSNNCDGKSLDVCTSNRCSKKEIIDITKHNKAPDYRTITRTCSVMGTLPCGCPEKIGDYGDELWCELITNSCPAEHYACDYVKDGCKYRCNVKHYMDKNQYYTQETTTLPCFTIV